MNRREDEMVLTVAEDRDRRRMLSPAAQRRIRLGKLLLDAGLTTRKSLAAALRKQRRSGEKLGDILVRAGALDPRELRNALALQDGLSDPACVVKMAGMLRESLGELFGREGAMAMQGLATMAVGHEPPVSGLQSSVPLMLGELLVTGGHLTRPQLAEALQRQQGEKKKLGEIILEAGYADRGAVQWGLRLQQKLVRAALIAVVSLSVATVGMTNDAWAGSAALDTQIQLNARVLPYARLTVVRQQSFLTITADDVRRGYVDVPDGSQIELRNNSRDGCLLLIESNGFPYEEVIVSGLDRDISIGRSGGMVMVPMMGTRQAALRFRFVLGKQATAGTYDWPLYLSARPM